MTLRAARAVVGAFRMHTKASFVRSNFSGLVIVLAGASAVTAQEALETAIRGDRSEQARQLAAAPSDTAPDRLRAGPVEFNIGLSYGFEFIDNVRNTSSPREEDYIQTPQVNFSGFLPVTDTGRLTLGIGIGYADYLKHNDLDRLYFSPNSELAYDFSVKDFRFTIFDSLDYSYDVQSVGALSGVSQFPRLENVVGIRALWAPSKWSYQAGYSHNNYITQSGSSQETDFGYLDRSSEQIFGRMAYSFAPGTRAGLEATLGITDYADKDQPDNVNSSIGPFVEWQVRESLTVSLRGGYTHYSFEGMPETTTAPIRPARPSRTRESYYAGFTANHRLTDYITHGVSVTRAIQAGVNQGSDYTETTVAGYFFNWNLTQNTTVSTTLNYAHGTESRQPGFDDEADLEFSTDYETYGAGMGAQHRITERITVSLNYNHTRRVSTSGGGNYFVNRVSLGLGYRF